MRKPRIFNLRGQKVIVTAGIAEEPDEWDEYQPTLEEQVKLPSELTVTRIIYFGNEQIRDVAFRLYGYKQAAQFIKRTSKAFVLRDAQDTHPKPGYRQIKGKLVEP